MIKCPNCKSRWHWIQIQQIKRQKHDKTKKYLCRKCYYIWNKTKEGNFIIKCENCGYTSNKLSDFNQMYTHILCTKCHKKFKESLARNDIFDRLKNHTYKLLR